jgi:uncharacterized membrane protein
VLLLVKLATLQTIIQIGVGLLSLWFGGMKLYRWIRRQLNKRKNHRS